MLSGKRRLLGTYELILTALDSLNIKYYFESVVAEADVSSCRSDCSTGRSLISFCLERLDLTDDDYERVSAWFRTRPSIMKHEDGIILTQG